MKFFKKVLFRNLTSDQLPPPITSNNLPEGTVLLVSWVWKDLSMRNLLLQVVNGRFLVIALDYKGSGGGSAWKVGSHLSEITSLNKYQQEVISKTVHKIERSDLPLFINFQKGNEFTSLFKGECQCP